MKTVTSYNRIEKQVTTFNRAEIELAVLKYFSIPKYKPDRTLNFELYETSTDEEIQAVVTLTYTKEELDGS